MNMSAPPVSNGADIFKQSNIPPQSSSSKRSARRQPPQGYPSAKGMCLRHQETLPAPPEKGHNLASKKSCVDNGGHYTDIIKCFMVEKRTIFGIRVNIFISIHYASYRS